MTRRPASIFTLIAATLLLSFAVAAQETGKPLAEKLKKGTIAVNSTIQGCDEDVKQHCPGLKNKPEKVFMCLSAYEDELTQQCKQGVIDAMLSIQTGLAKIEYSVRSCEADADTFCLDVQPGEGRMLKCLKTNETSLSPKCIGALKETGFWDQVQ